MAFEKCLEEIRKVAGEELTEETLDELLSELQRRQNYVRATHTQGNAEEALRKAAEELADDIKTAAIIEKRNAAINLRKRLEAVDFVRSQFPERPELGVEALLVGVNRVARGSRFSAAAMQKELAGFYVSGIIADIEKLGLWREFVSGTLDRDIARALWAKGQDVDVSRIDPRARQIADAVEKWQEVARVDANKAGAWIKKMPGYIVRQSHDIYKIRRVGFEAWRDFVLERLDPRTFEGADDPDAFLRNVYDGLASGVHMKSTGARTGFKGPSNLAKRMSQERVLHFRDADAWADYNERFGTGNFREALLYGLERMGHNTGLMRALGTNPEANLNMILDDLAESLRGDPEKMARFRDDRNWLMNRLKEVDGSVYIPAHTLGARVSAIARVIQNLAKLGAAVVSAVADIPLYASEMKYQGAGLLEGMGNAIQGLLKGKTLREKRELLSSIGVFFDSMRGEAVIRFSAHDDLPGTMARWQMRFFKFNGLTWWTDTLRASAALMMSHRLAWHRNKSWRMLGPDLKRVLGIYGIDEGKWDIIRQAAPKLDDGREYVVPEAIRDLPDEVFAGYLKGQGFNPTEARIAELKREIESQLRSYFVDRTEYAVTVPDARTHAIMRRGTRPGTVEGELLRFVGQFKSFPVAVIQKHLGREVYGRGYAGADRGIKSLISALRNGNGEILGLAQLMVWNTLFGYGAMTAKDMLKGRAPRDWNSPKTWTAALVQGGGLGIYGDFLFGEMRNRFGATPLSTFLGPTLGATEDIIDIFGRLRDGDDAAAATTKFIINNTPFLNLFYTRIALDYLFLYQIQEMMNPGYLRRMEKRIEEDNAQSFLVRPSAAIPRGGGDRVFEGVR